MDSLERLPVMDVERIFHQCRFEGNRSLEARARAVLDKANRRIARELSRWVPGRTLVRRICRRCKSNEHVRIHYCRVSGVQHKHFVCKSCHITGRKVPA